MRASSPRLVSCVAVAVRPCGALRGALAPCAGETRRPTAPAATVAADLVQRQQRVIAIERGVLQRLRRHRSGELLHLQRELAHPRPAVGPAVADRGRASIASRRKSKMSRSVPAQRRRAAAIVRSMMAAVVVAAAGRRHVGAVDREFEDVETQRFAQPIERIVARAEMAGGDAAQQLHQHVELARHDGVEHAKLRSSRASASKSPARPVQSRATAFRAVGGRRSSSSTREIVFSHS